MNAPEGFRIPTPEEFQEWQYIYQERIGISVGTGIPTQEDIARASFEADRAVERAFGVECWNGWMQTPINLTPS